MAVLDKMDEIAFRAQDDSGVAGIVTGAVNATTDAIRKLLREAVENGLAVYNKGATALDVVFIETDSEKLDALYPAEEGE